ncbi:hypothetical protein IWW48_000556 [Coemansia sp. RSA 1200]|nr:hypothetical protein IWW48_000556 [Coemansia sp. RSA 1200]
MYVTYTEPVWEERARARGLQPAARRIAMGSSAVIAPQRITVVTEPVRRVLAGPAEPAVVRVIERRRVRVRVYVYFGRREAWSSRFGHFDVLVADDGDEGGWSVDDVKDAAEIGYSQTIGNMVFVQQKYQSALAFEGSSHVLFEKTLLFYVRESELADYRVDVKPFIRSIGAA